SETDEVRYYLSSRVLSGRRFAEAVRGHWGIESMHWVLDVNFREDDSRTRERTLGNNLSWLRRFAVTLLKRHPDKDSLRGKMMSCCERRRESAARGGGRTSAQMGDTLGLTHCSLPTMEAHRPTI